MSRRLPEAISCCGSSQVIAAQGVARFGGEFAIPHPTHYITNYSVRQSPLYYYLIDYSIKIV